MKKVFTLLMLLAAVAVSCQKNGGGKNGGKNGGKDDGKGIAIKIDGDFNDWASLDPTKVSVAKNDPNSPWSAVTEIRCCADADFVYYYVKYNKSELKDLLDGNDELFARLNLNTDGEFTSGYKNYSLEGYDFIAEGAIGDGKGGFGDFACELSKRNDQGDWDSLLPSTSGLVMGKGAGNEYEILLARELFNNAVPADHKMGDVFYTGMRFYQGDWEELANIPNAAVDDENPNGWGHLMKVTTIK
jgi:hypothetical protein